MANPCYGATEKVTGDLDEQISGRADNWTVFGDLDEYSISGRAIFFYDFRLVNPVLISKYQWYIIDGP